jgi:hypothetical protein
MMALSRVPPRPGARPARPRARLCKSWCFFLLCLLLLLDWLSRPGQPGRAARRPGPVGVCRKGGKGLAASLKGAGSRRRERRLRVFWFALSLPYLALHPALLLGRPRPAPGRAHGFCGPRDVGAGGQGEKVHQDAGGGRVGDAHGKTSLPLARADSALSTVLIFISLPLSRSPPPPPHASLPHTSNMAVEGMEHVAHPWHDGDPGDEFPECESLLRERERPPIKAGAGWGKRCRRGHRPRPGHRLTNAVPPRRGAHYTSAAPTP